MKIYWNSLWLVFFILLFCTKIDAKTNNKAKDKLWSVKIAESFLERNPKLISYNSSENVQEWNYEQGLMLETLKQMYQYTGEDKYFNYIKQNIDGIIDDNGNIRTYNLEDYNVDQILPGRAVLYLFQTTGEDKYRKAIELLVKQINTQPRTNSKGFWHKKIYPYQIWLDGFYMAQPFIAEYSKVFNQPQNFNDILNQFSAIYNKVKEPRTGLLYHSWDESKQERWANSVTGTSSSFWGRAIGWYLMALVDVLDYCPKDHPLRNHLIFQLQDICNTIIKFRDPEKKIWYQVIDQPHRKGNYPEASATSMFAYVFAKGANNAFLDPMFYEHAKTTFEGIVKEFVKVDNKGLVNLTAICEGAGLGGNPYRDGSFEYYTNENTRINDFKGYGPFLLASIELERGRKNLGEGINVVLDHYYNNETRKNRVTGLEEEFHYTWADTSMAGYSNFGEVFQKYGANISELKTAPTKENINNFSIYIITDPDTPQETANPNYILENDIDVIVEWVKNGGFLLLLANDKGNAEFEHLNNLTKRFGMSFNEVSISNFEGNENRHLASFINLPQHPIFNNVAKIYMRGISTINVDAPQYVIVKKDDQPAISFKRFEKGAVMMVGDPWLYNEYIAHRVLSKDYENNIAAHNLVAWMLALVNVIND